MSSTKEFWIKNTVCNRCLKVIEQELKELDITVLSLELGKLLVEAPSKDDNTIIKNVKKVLHSNSFEVVQSEKEMLVERVKIILIEQLAKLPLDIKVKTSELLVTALHYDYKLLSKLLRLLRYRGSFGWQLSVKQIESLRQTQTDNDKNTRHYEERSNLLVIKFFIK